MKLNIEDIAGYLPYGLKGQYQLQDVRNDVPFEIREKELRSDNVDFFLVFCKPILYPMSVIDWPLIFNDKEIVLLHQIQRLYPGSTYIAEGIDYVKSSGKWMLNTNRDGEVPINIMRQIDRLLYKAHFDIHDLISQDLAINKLEQKKS